MSATSLRLLLRDPIRFVWRYVLGWRQPDESEEPLTLDALAFGILVHEILQTAVSTLEADGGFGRAETQAVEKAVESAVAAGRQCDGGPEQVANPPKRNVERQQRARATLRQRLCALAVHPLAAQK
jgi:hypothetical protein